MGKKAFIQALWPLWAFVILVDVGRAALRLGGVEITGYFSTAILAVLVVLLPFIAGLRVVRSDGGIPFAILGGISIPVIRIITVGMIFFVQSPEWEPILGFLISNIVIAFIPTILFSALGGVVAKKAIGKAT